MKISMFEQRESFLRGVAVSILCAPMVIWISGCIPMVETTLSPQQEVAKAQKVIALIEEATTLMNQGTERAYQEAQHTLSLARELNPEDPRIFDGLGCIEWRRNHPKLAEEFFKRAIEVDSAYDRAYAHLALIAEAEGDYKAAGELYKIAIELNPMNYRARNNFAAFELERNNRNNARKNFLKALHAGGQDEAIIADNLELIEN